MTDSYVLLFIVKVDTSSALPSVFLPLSLKIDTARIERIIKADIKNSPLVALKNPDALLPSLEGSNIKCEVGVK
jgi:hypothetical protein